MIAPGVASLMVTLCTDVYVPAGGVKVGIAAVGRAVMVSVPETKVKV
jgi:hypothetical protein